MLAALRHSLDMYLFLLLLDPLCRWPRLDDCLVKSAAGVSLWQWGVYVFWWRCHLVAAVGPCWGVYVVWWRWRLWAPVG